MHLVRQFPVLAAGLRCSALLNYSPLRATAAADLLPPGRHPIPPLPSVEDDDTCASFPFNSCGTAAYVAPEALICNKKVNSSVDVYAFGILM